MILQQKASKIVLIVFIAFATCVGAWAALAIHNMYLTRYFDLITMHQPTYNTYMGIKEGDFSRILEMSDPHEHRGQISRLNYHFDIILIPISLLYFIYEGPETLLVFQSFMLSLAMLPLYLLVVKVFESDKHKYSYAVLIALIYMLYLPIHNTNMDTFHPVSLAPVVLLFMVYFSITKKYFFSIIFFLISLTIKESVALATGAYAITLIAPRFIKKNADEQITKKTFYHGIFILLFSIFWFLIVMYVFIPHFRSGSSYYLNLYKPLGETPLEVISSIILKPDVIISKLTSPESISYLWLLIGTLALVPLAGAIYLIPTVPEFLINQLSIAPYMANALGHYSTISVPFIFLALIYGLLALKKIMTKVKLENLFFSLFGVLLIFGLSSSLIYSYIFNIYTVIENNSTYRRISSNYFEDLDYWKKELADKDIKISASTNIAPHFGNRRYIYLAAMDYKDADYVIFHEEDLTSFLPEEQEKQTYRNILNDQNYATIYHNDLFWVLKKVNYEQN